MRAGIPGSRKPRDPATLVGADSTAPAGAFRRPKTAGPALRPEISARFAAAQGSAGGPWPSPTTGRSPRPTGKRHSHVITNLCRGRCSHRPGNPAAARTPAGGINPAPTVHGQRPANRNGRGRPGGRRAGCPIPPDPAAARTSAGGYGIPPYSQRKMPRSTGKRHSHVITNLCRGRCSHRPGNPAAARTPAGGYGIRPYSQRQGPRPTGKRHSRVITNLCRGRCLHRPGNRAAARTPAGGINPAPTAHGQRPANWNGRVYPGVRRAGCPIPPDPAAVRTPAGGYGIRPYGYILCFGPNGKAAAKPAARAVLVQRVFHNKKGLLPKKAAVPFFIF